MNGKHPRIRCKQGVDLNPLLCGGITQSSLFLCFTAHVRIDYRLLLSPYNYLSIHSRGKTYLFSYRSRAEHLIAAWAQTSQQWRHPPINPLNIDMTFFRLLVFTIFHSSFSRPSENLFSIALHRGTKCCGR